MEAFKEKLEQIFDSAVVAIDPQHAATSREFLVSIARTNRAMQQKARDHVRQRLRLIGELLDAQFGDSAEIFSDTDWVLYVDGTRNAEFRVNSFGSTLIFCYSVGFEALSGAMAYNFIASHGSVLAIDANSRESRRLVGPLEQDWKSRVDAFLQDFCTNLSQQLLLRPR